MRACRKITDSIAADISGLREIGLRKLVRDIAYLQRRIQRQELALDGAYEKVALAYIG